MRASYRGLALLTVVLAVFGSDRCAASGYSKYFVSTMPTPKTKSAPSPFMPSPAEPELRFGSEPKADYLNMVEDGYALVGYSSFYGPAENPASAKSKAKSIHAAVVVVYSSNPRTTSETVPTLDLSFIADALNPKTATTQTSGTIAGSGGSLNYSQTSTTTLPRESRPAQTTTYTSTIYDQFTGFWLKTKPARLGIVPRDLTAEERAARGSNKGLAIVGVIKGSPAFKADVMRGDILLKIADLEVSSWDDLSAALDQYAGTEVDLSLVRGTTEKTIHVKLNPNTQ